MTANGTYAWPKTAEASASERSYDRTWRLLTRYTREGGVAGLVEELARQGERWARETGTPEGTGAADAIAEFTYNVRESVAREHFQLVVATWGLLLGLPAALLLGTWLR